MLDVTRNGRQNWRPLILSYRDERTLRFAEGWRAEVFDRFAYKAELKLDQLDSAATLRDLNLPGNRFAALKGNRKSQYSILINDQWRICFKWPKGSKGPTNVEIDDYHRGSNGTRGNSSWRTPERAA